MSKKDEAKQRARYTLEFKLEAVRLVKAGQEVSVTFPGNPYDGHILSAQLEQTAILLEDVGVRPRQVVVDLGYRGVDADNPGVAIIHRGKFKSLTRQQKRWLRRRQAVEPAIGHLKQDHRMDRCWLQGATGDAIHAVLCAVGYNLRWLLRAIIAKGIKPLFLCLFAWWIQALRVVAAEVRGIAPTVDARRGPIRSMTAPALA
jgi:IS5 family transposase